MFPQTGAVAPPGCRPFFDGVDMHKKDAEAAAAALFWIVVVVLILLMAGVYVTNKMLYGGW